MSDAAYRRAIAETIAEKWSLSRLACDVRPDAKPPHGARQAFFAVHGMSKSGDPMDGNVINEMYSFGVTISLRGTDIPWDRFNATIESHSVLDYWNNGLDYLGRKVKELIHGKYNVMNRANTHIQAFEGEQTGFVVPCFYLGAAEAVVQSSNWWEGQIENPNVLEGMSQTLQFGRAQRIEYIDHAAI